MLPRQTKRTDMGFGEVDSVMVKAISEVMSWCCVSVVFL
jgi:hypothetical protein